LQSFLVQLAENFSFSNLVDMGLQDRHQVIMKVVAEEKSETFGLIHEEASQG
jgi:hypothetical protein